MNTKHTRLASSLHAKGRGFRALLTMSWFAGATLACLALSPSLGHADSSVSEANATGIPDGLTEHTITESPKTTIDAYQYVAFEVDDVVGVDVGAFRDEGISSTVKVHFPGQQWTGTMIVFTGKKPPANAVPFYLQRGSVLYRGELGGEEDSVDNWILDLTLASSGGSSINDILLSKAEVDENLPIGTVVGEFIAADADAGATLTYSLSDGNGSTHNHLFFLDANGTLETAAVYDYEVNATLTIRVQVKDDRNATFNKVFAISVTDVNEAPVITSLDGNATGRLSYAEPTGLRRDFLHLVKASDADGDALYYELAGGADVSKFSITLGGSLTFSNPPDYENPTDSNGDNAYEVAVRAREYDRARAHQNDAPRLALSAFQTILVTVTDANDPTVITSLGGNATAFLSSPENRAAVTTVTATDPDDDTLVYRLLNGEEQGSFVRGADQEKFDLNETTGELTFKVPPDYENPTDAGADNTYEVSVSVTDASDTFFPYLRVLADVQTITVTVTDVNENPLNSVPVITSDGGGSAASVSAQENQAAVATVTATDADGDALTYSIGGTDQDKFVINAVTGFLNFTVPSDSENPTDADGDNLYEVSVSVSDGGLSDEQLVRVKVENVNEPPVITSDGGGDTASVSIPEKQTLVTEVNATNAEAANGANVMTYSLTAGADIDEFDLNGSTGELAFKAPPDFENPTDADGNNAYVVEVTVSCGNRTDTQTITVSVTDVNESPVITSNGDGDTATASVREDQTLATVVNAMPPVAGDVFTYDIAGGAD
jgi:hypothetical protein